MAITLGQAHETALTLEKAGATLEFWSRLAQNLELAKEVVALVMSTIFRLATKVERDAAGWTCVEPVEAEGDFEPSLCEFLKEGETMVGGEEMIRRAKEQGVQSGLRHAEAMLRNQERIPVEWRKFVLIFPEVWLGSSGGRSVWYLLWDGGRWCLLCSWLGLDFDSVCRLVSSRKYQK